MYIACIDTGTTNTRVSIYEDNNFKAEAKVPVGVRRTSITGSKNELHAAVRKSFIDACSKAKITEHDISLILASGMITSDLGLLEVPHITAPVSSKMLSEHIVTKIIPEVSTDIPIHFIPGIKNRATDYEKLNIDDIALMDMMRGEEVEAFGALYNEKIEAPAILILPGSHTKFVFVNENSEIVGCLTTMAGETLMQYTISTIISDALQHEYAQSIDAEYLKAGAENCIKYGLTRAAFCVRIMEQFTDSNLNERENYLLGAVVQSDLQCLFGRINPKDVKTILICGSSSFAEGFYSLLKSKPETEKMICKTCSKTNQHMSAFGSMLVARKAGLL